MKKTLLLFFVVLLSFSVKAETIADTAFAGGSGTEDDPYQIATLAQLRLLSDSSKYWSNSFILTADINASDTKTWNYEAGFIGIGGSTPYFTGNFNGDFHVIDSLFCDSVKIEYNGLFRYVIGSTIKNVGLTNCDMTMDDLSGALVGVALDFTVIENCYSTGEINGNGANRLGGLIGYLNNSYLYSSYSTADVGSTGSSDNIAGLIGIIEGCSIVENCYATGNISSQDYCSGLFGKVQTDAASIKNCYFSGTSDKSIIMYSNKGSELAGIYYDSTREIGSSSVAKGLTSDMFALDSNFVDWDFNGTWHIDSISEIDTVVRPYLRWQLNTYDVEFSCDTSLGKLGGVLSQFLFEGENTTYVTATEDSTDKIFMRWVDQNGNVISRENPLRMTNITSDSTVIAIFSDTYLVEFYSKIGGSLSGDSVQYVKIDSNSETVTAIAAEGFYFSEWQDVSGKIVSTDNPLILSNVSSDTTVYAVFYEKESAVEISNNSDINVYPNPTTGKINISINGTCQLVVYNIAGQSVYSNTTFAGGVVDLSDLQKGMYIISVKQQDNVSLTRIIKN